MEQLIQTEQLKQSAILEELQQLNENLKAAITQQNANEIEQIVGILAQLNHKLALSQNFVRGLKAKGNPL